MKVLFLAPYLYDTAPSQRYRMEQWEHHLAAMGVRITHAPFVSPKLHQALYQPGRYLTKTREVLGGMVRRWRDVRRAGDFDLVFVHREASLFGPAFFERLLKRRGTPIVFEMDDAVFLPYVSPANRWLSYLKFPNKIGRICELADHVIVGSEYLADFARQHNPRVTVIPTTVDTDRYTPRAEPRRAGPLRIGWCGSHSTTRYLRTLTPVFEELCAMSDFHLLFVGAQTFSLPGRGVEFRTWTSKNEVRDLAEMDVGVMPVPEEEWAKGKQGLKALLYMSMEIPVVASPVGANTEIIQDGVNGFLARSQEEWIGKLHDLLLDQALRRRLGTAGRETVLARYSARSQVSRVYEVLEQSVQRGKAMQLAQTA